MSSSSKRTASASRSSSSASVVSALQRASFGVHTLPTGATDEDIAKMIADEAKKKETIWKEFGLGVYAPRPASSTSQPRPGSTLKPNTSFLSSMIRSVDGHNQALLRQQALAARGSRDSSLSRGGGDAAEGSSSSRKSGTGPSGKGMRGWDDHDSRPSSSSGREREDSRSSGKERDSDRDRGGSRRDEDRGSGSRRKDRDRSNDRDDTAKSSSSRRRHDDRSDREDDSEDEERRRRRRRRREEEEGRGESSSRSRRRDDDWDWDRNHHSSRSSRRSRSPESDRKRTSDRPSSSSDKRDDTMIPPLAADVPSTHPLRTTITIGSSPTRSTSSEPGPSHPPPSSKMDKYFEESYDPSMDVAPPPKTGLVGDGWERMLEAMKEKEDEKRRAKRREKKLLEKAERKAARKARKVASAFHSSSSDDSDSSSGARKKRKAAKAKKEAEAKAKKPTWLEEAEKREQDVMAMKYPKMGEKKAWDVGKDEGADAGSWKNKGKGGKGGREEEMDVVEREMRKWDEGEGLKGFDDLW